MDYAALGVAGIATLVAVTLLARRIRVATPLVLVLVGVGVSFLPGVPPVEVPPDQYYHIDKRQIIYKNIYIK